MADTPKILITAQLNKAVSLSNITKDLKDIEKQIPALNLAVNINGNAIKTQLSSISSQFKTEKIDFGANIDTTKITKYGSTIKEVSDKVALLAQKMQLLQAQAEKAGIELNQTKLDNFTNALNNFKLPEATVYLKEIRNEYSLLNTEMSKSLPQTAIENLNNKIVNMSTGITTLENRFKSLGNSQFIPKDLDSQISNLRNQLSNINNIDKPEEKIQAYNQLVQSVQKLNNAYKTTAQETRLLNQDNNLTVDKIKFLNSIDAWSTKNSKALKMVGTDLDIIKSKVNDTDRATLTNLQKQFRSVVKEAEAAGKTGRSFSDEIKNDLGKVFQWFGASTIIFGSIAKIRDVVSTIEDLNKAATDLQMVTGGNSQQTAQLLTQYNQLATQIGATTTEVASSAGEWLRQGKSIADTNTLIKDSMVLSKVANLDSAESTQYLTSAMKGNHKYSLCVQKCA